MLNSPRCLLCLLAGFLGIIAMTSCDAASAPVVPAGDPRHEILVLLRLPPAHFRPDADYGDGYGDAMTRAARKRVALALAHRHGLGLLGDWPMPLVGVDCFIMTVPDDRSPADEAASLSRDPGVSWAEPVRLYRGEGGPADHRDPLFMAQPAARENP